MAESVAITRFRTLRNLRKIKQYRRLGNSEKRPIYALDTEATPEGIILLIADNKGNKLDFDKLTAENVLKFLFSTRYQDSWNLFWNISYDTRIILRLLGKDILRQPQRRSRLVFKAFGFTVSIIDNKSLTITKGKNSASFYDIMQFYPEKKLAEAYQKHIGKLDKKYLDMKSQRESFSKEYYRKNRKQIREYCIKDCILTKELSEHWIELFFEAFGFYASRWLSSGYLAEKILIKNNIVIPLLDETPEDVNEIATNSTFGGRIELVTRGFVSNVYLYDIKSAYPFALSQIPQITKGTWFQSTRLNKNSLLGFFKIRCNIPKTKHISPFPFHSKNGKTVYANGQFITFVTLAEIKACEDSSWYDILDSWQYIDDNPEYPYKEFIELLYQKRQKLKQEKNSLELPFKVILNSIYGKTGQGERINSRMGNMLNPIIFSTINGMCRAQIYKFIIDNKIERIVCMIYTDAITTTENLNLQSEKIGNFSLDVEGEAYLLQNGFYRIGEKFRNRGLAKIGKDAISELEPFVDKDGKVKYTFEQNKVGTLRENLNRGTFENIGKFTKITRDFNINADRGRFWIGKLTDVRKKETNYSVPFSFPEFDPDRI